MKELSIEEKAKRYDEILARAKGANLPYYKEDIMSKVKEFVDYILPELKESDDENVRKDMIETIKKESKDFPSSVIAEKSHTWLAWLKKQGEQKLNTDFSDLRTWKYIVDAVWTEKEGIGQYLDSPFTEEVAKKLQKRFGNIKQSWSEEDSRILYNVKAYIGYAAGQSGVKDELFKEANEWLNSLPIGFVYNKNYNEDMVTLLVGELKQIANDNNAPEQYQVEINWLKSIRPQNRWKPSEEQIKVLEFFVPYVTKCNVVLQKSKDTLLSLLTDLKKLKEE